MSTLQAAAGIEELVNHQQPESISLIMPTYSAGRRVTQNAIRFKNLVREAVDKLMTYSDCSEREAERRLAPLIDRQHDDSFWQKQSAGLAMYFFEGGITSIPLSDSPERLVYLSDHFYIAPIAAQASTTKRHDVLTVTWETANLWEATQADLQPIDCEQFPVDFADIVLPPDREEQLQFHSQRGGDADVMYHGQGEGEKSIEADRRRFLSEVGKRVQDLLGTVHDQLIVIATSEVAGQLAATGLKPAITISASPAKLARHALHERIREALKYDNEREEQEQKQLKDKLGTALAQGKGSRDPLEIIQAAAAGRVSHLLVDTNCRLWGNRGPDGHLLEKLNTDGECEAINLAMLHALRTGAEISVCASESPMAAILRY